MGCRHRRTFNDVFSGEVVCLDCGEVLGETDYAPPPQIKIDRGIRGFECTSYRLGTSLARSIRKRWFSVNGQAKTEMRVAMQIERICSWLGAPSKVEGQSVIVARKILRAMREGFKPFRMSVEDIAAISVFLAYRFMEIPMSARMYSDILLKNRYGRKRYDRERVFRLYRRVAEVIALPKYRGSPIDYIRRIVSRLEGRFDSRYISLMESYAVRIFIEASENNGSLLWGRSPILVSAALLIAADMKLGGLVGAESIIEAASVSGNAKALASWLLGFTPPVPPEALRYRLGVKDPVRVGGE